MKDKALTTGQISKQLGVNLRTVIGWIEKGNLKAFKLPGRGDHRIQKDDYLSFLNKFNIPVPEEMQAKKALIIDDEPAQAEIITLLIEALGFEVDVAQNGFEAGEKLGSFNPSLVILDIFMPGMDGYEVLKYIRGQEKYEYLPIIIASSDSPERISKNVDDKYVRIIQKPDGFKKIKGLVEEFNFKTS